MTATTTTTRPKKSRPPSQIRRRVQHIEALRCGIHLFNYRSNSRQLEDPHRVEVDLTNGYVHCSCEDFQFRYARKWPKIPDTELHCRHLEPCLNWLRRHHYLESAPALQRPCRNCGVDGAEHELADGKGRPVEGGFLCNDCVKRARMMEEPVRVLPMTPEELGSPADYKGFAEYLAEVQAAQEFDEWLEDMMEEAYRAEHPPCPICQCPTNKECRETGRGQYNAFVCDSHGEVEIREAA